MNSNNKLGGVMRFVKWQLNSILNPYPIVYNYTENSKFLIKKGWTGATGNLYCGLMEFEDMGFLLHFLRKEDFFLDIGANVGAYTILASAEVEAKTVCIEPVPSTYMILNDNIVLNNMASRVKALNIGLGSEKGIIKFTKSFDTVNHVATEKELGKETIDVQVETLDSILDYCPILMKIDVEGFETEVLKGGKNTLENRDLKAVIIELNGSGKRYGYDETLIHENLISLDFKPYSYNPFTKTLTELSTFAKHNTIYLRDIPFVTNRIETSKKVKIRNIVI